MVLKNWYIKIHTKIDKKRINSLGEEFKKLNKEIKGVIKKARNKEALAGE